MIEKLIYHLSRGALMLTGLLPSGVLFFLGDGLAFVMHRIVRYRLSTVRRNLRNSFPEKPKAELRRIEHDFYRYLADYLAFQARLIRVSHEELTRRIRYVGDELFREMCLRHGGVFLLIPHYSFFEGLVGMASILDEGVLPVNIYKPLHNRAMDRLFISIRSRFGSINIPKHSTARMLVRNFRQGHSMAVGLVSDQNPNCQEANYWTTFLSQDTVFMDGPEKMARLMNFPVFYSEFFHGPERGCCTVRMDLLAECPRELEEGGVTELFARRLEGTIRRDPAPWLWSHRRWKMSRPKP